MFIDASAFCAILLGEPESQVFQFRIASTSEPTTSPVAVWETVRALARETEADVPVASILVQNLLDAAAIAIVPIGEPEQGLALEAFDRFGKGRHPARLNMGDCFAYACARTGGKGLLYKGDDFLQTDIPLA